MKPKLFILKMPFEDGVDKIWICADCVLVEGALSLNPHWINKLDVSRLDFPKPRREVVELLGENNQGLPVLILGNNKTLTEPLEIINYLANEFGGAAAHP